jgi:hypothetical protein
MGSMLWEKERRGLSLVDQIKINEALLSKWACFKA